MKIKTPLRAAALVLCLCLALAGCTFPFDFDLPGLGASSAAEEEARDRRTIPYADMEYARPDVDSITAQVEELTAQAAEAEDLDALLELDDAVTALYEAFNTQQTLAFLRTHLDVNDAFYDEETRYLDDAWADLSLTFNDFNRVLVEGDLRTAYKQHVGSYTFEAIETSLLMNSESVKEYLRERNTLYLDYNDWINTYTISHEGRDYTLEDIYGVYSADSAVLYEQLSYQYFAEYADDFTQMYARMVELDKLTSNELGFSDPATMYYLQHGRDYAPADGQAMIDEVKATFVPLLYDVMGRQYETEPMTIEKTFQLLPQALEQVDPELGQAWDFMNEYGLYDVAATPGKSTTMQFTTNIDGYDAPFIFTYWRDDFGSATTLAHEFGHFYDNWLHYDSPSTYCTDVAEIYSQGLELLLHPLYDDWTALAEEARLDSLQDFFYGAILMQSLYEEFQLRIYQLDSFDAVVAGRLFAELLGEYGLRATVDEYGADYSWITIGHFFYSPFYTISYVTSAAVALQIWAESTSDWDAAVATYMDLIHADQAQPFAKLLKSAGLKPPSATGTITDIADTFAQAFSEEGLDAAA